MENKITKQVNCGGICSYCKTKNLHYGIGNGSFTYWCNECQKALKRNDIDMNNMKIITLSKIGYNAPSGANWAWGIWKLDLVDTNIKYCMSYTLKENFAGDYRLRETVKNTFNKDIIETKGTYPTQKITGVRSMLNMESKEVMAIIEEFITKK